MVDAVILFQKSFFFFLGFGKKLLIGLNEESLNSCSEFATAYFWSHGYDNGWQIIVAKETIINRCVHPDDKFHKRARVNCREQILKLFSALVLGEGSSSDSIRVAIWTLPSDTICKKGDGNAIYTG